MALIMDPILVAFVPNVSNEKLYVAKFLLIKFLVTVQLSRKFPNLSQRFASVYHAPNSKLQIVLLPAVIRPWFHSLSIMPIPFEAGLIQVQSSFVVFDQTQVISKICKNSALSPLVATHSCLSPSTMLLPFAPLDLSREKAFAKTYVQSIDARQLVPAEDVFKCNNAKFLGYLFD